MEQLLTLRVCQISMDCPKAASSAIFSYAVLLKTIAARSHFCLRTYWKPEGEVIQVVHVYPSSNPSPLIKIRQEWENELGIQFEDSWWVRAKLQVNYSSSCARLNLIQYKVLHRIHFSKAKLAKFFPGTSDACNRCAFVPSDLAHTFWLCSKLTGFWKNFFKIISKVLDIDIHCPLIAIFGVPLNYSEFSQRKLNVLAFASLIAPYVSFYTGSHQNPRQISPGRLI